MSFINRVFAGLGFTTAAGVGLYRLALRQTQTPQDGVVSPPGVKQDVEIIRDRAGVPHLYAATCPDLYYALGFVHAQDRLWQMDLQRRLARGLLSEIFGETTLLFDRYVRRLGLARVAEAEARDATPEERAVLDAYAAGVNGFLRTYPGRLPVEFRILRYRPRPWEPVDTLAWAKAISWLLSANWDNEWFRFRLVQRLGPEGAAALDPGYAEGHPVTTAPGEPYAGTADGLLAGLRLIQQELGLVAGGASNAWAVAPERSATGGALLASDPHLQPQLPSIWYQAHLCAEDQDVVGATMPGLPAVLIGHNQRVAWGITASMVDTQDLFIEQIDPDNPDVYRTPAGWARFARRIEEISVRGRAEPVVEEVRETRHGPILTPLLFGETRPLALASTLLRPRHTTRGAVALNRARNWEEFRAALSDWDLPMNFVYADRDGNIGYQLSGAVPKRRDDGGVVPVPGWDGAHDWTGIVPFDEMPRVYNPPSGFVVSANNCLVDDAYPHNLSRDWVDGYRAMRIENVLQSKERVTIDDCAALQLDFTSEAARQLVELLADVEPTDPLDVRALAHLCRWDCRLTADSVPAAIYSLLRARLLRNLFAARLGPLLNLYIGSGPAEGIAGSAYPARASSMLVRALRQADPAMLEGTGFASWAELKRASLAQAVLDLRARLGDDPDDWRWGRLHAVTFGHVFGRVKPLAPIFSRGPYPVGGDGDTPHQAANGSGDFSVCDFVPSYRQIVDLADLSRSLWVIPGGQSGLVGHPHYADQLPLWRAGRYQPMLYNREAVLDNLDHLLILRPK